MKVSVQGIKHAKGEYEGTAYDNMNIHAVYRDPDVIGLAVQVVKVKTPVYVNFMSDEGLAADTELCGKTLNVEYDRYGRVVDLSIVEPKK